MTLGCRAVALRSTRSTDMSHHILGRVSAVEKRVWAMICLCETRFCIFQTTPPHEGGMMRHACSTRMLHRRASNLIRYAQRRGRGAPDNCPITCAVASSDEFKTFVPETIPQKSHKTVYMDQQHQRARTARNTSNDPDSRYGQSSQQQGESIWRRLPSADCWYAKWFGY